MATLRSVSSTASNSESFTCPRPAGTAAGDVLLAFQTAGAPDYDGMTTPTGGGTTWQLLRARNAFDWGGSKVWWKVAGPSEPARYNFRQAIGYFDSVDSVVAIVAISDSDGSIPRVASTDDSLVCPAAIATTAPGVTVRWVATLLSDGDASWGTPSGHTKQVDRSVSSTSELTTSAILATRSRTAVGSTGSATFGLDGASIFFHAFTVDVGGTSGPPPIPPEVIPPSPDIHNRFVFCDAATDDFIADLDLTDVNYSRVIGDAGTFSAKIDVPNAEVAELVATVIPRWDIDDIDPDSLSTGPGRTVCHVYRNGIVWGTYLIWQAVVNIDEQGHISVSIQGATLESYLGHVEIREDLIYEGTDQLEIASDLIGSMQTQTHANVGLTVESATSGVPRDHSYLASEIATYGQRLKELADLDNGFEWMIHTSDPGTGARVREVQFGYPKLGSAVTEHVFSQPGNVVSITQTIDALRGGTSYRARGESVSTDVSTTSVPLMSSPKNAAAYFTAGWLRLDVTKDYSTVKEVDTLNAYATRWAAERPGAIRVHQVTVRLDDSDFTPANLGDYAKLLIVNDWWPIRNGGASFNRRWRIIGVSVRATSRTSQETVTLTFAEEVEI